MDTPGTPSRHTTRTARQRRRRTGRLLTALAVTATALTLAVAGLTSASEAQDAAYVSTGSGTSWRLPGIPAGMRGSSWAARLPGSDLAPAARGSSWS